ncbi:glycolate oxidase subunit GlcE [Methylocystis parvus]|uniref:Glycolate oxidase subunit GlcE n=1 Tax=Methylocystis parvus TaxID=134 RepID=A0A6B8M1M1_9HYPH|nr:glycolate oxidase subunit GlcE [Methylocystis parvus]QGM96238.1 glycolate oxidase subunit GlcE [Methylocystis parvus]WBJ99931.1 glycolate oxidase subunit GlcE [Methylocystis parvus OBBP]
MSVDLATLEICDAREAVEAVREANARNAPLALVGGGTKRRLGRHAPQERELSTRALAGVTLYEPEELVLSARAGTPLREIEELLDAHDQQLAFEPMDYATLYGDTAKGATIGGAIAVNASGPRRIKAGAARDHLLGFHCVTGRGEIVKSGGRVMKNVTGYDLSKLVCGSYGTLALLTEVTLKALPKAETEQTLMVLGLDEAQSVAALRRASGTPNEVSSFAMLPAGAPPLGLAGHTALLRIEGPEISVVTRRDALAASLVTNGERFETLPEAQSRALWRAVRDAAPVACRPGPIWRLSVAPTDGFEAVEALRRAGAPILAHFYDWAGGLVWLGLDDAPDAHAAAVRAAVNALGGHAALIRASEDIRRRVDVFHPQPAPLAALTRRVKESFDPAHVLERGRMREDF